MFHGNLLKSGGLLLALLCTAAAQAQTVTVRDAWIRGTVQGQSATGAFMELSAKADARLVAASSPVAKVTEVHNMRMESGVMRMFPVAGIDIPAGKSIRLASGGYHVMLMQIDKPLNPGDKVPLLLTFELMDRKRETVELSVEVRDLKGQPKKGHHHH
jgi:periplasmic copper chaperone A